MNKTILKVNGMSCNHCKMAVEKAVQELKDVEDAKVNVKIQLLTTIGCPGSSSLWSLQHKL